MTMSLGLESVGYRAAAPAAAAVPASGVITLVRGTLLLFVMSIPFEIPRRTIPIEIPTFFMIVFLASTLLNPTRCYRKIPTALIWFALHLWILAIAAVVSGVEHMQSVVKHFVTLTMLLMLLWSLSNVLSDARAVRLLILGFIAACTVRATLQILNIGTHRIAVWTGGERITVLGQNTNMSAIVLAAGLMMVVGLFAAPGKWLPKLPFLTWPLAAVMGWATIQTGSRGGLFCIAAGLLVFLFSGRTPLIRFRNVLIGLIAIGALGWAATESPMMRQRLQAAASEGNFAGRERIYPALTAMLRERPLLGWGPIENQFEIGKRITERKRVSRDAHNLAGELLTTSGVIGALPFFIGLGLCIFSAWKGRRGALGYLPLALLATVLTGCISGTWLVSKILWFALALALAAGMRWSDPVTQKIWSVEPCAA